MLRKITLLILFLSSFILLSMGIANAQNDEVNLYLFYSETCPHCHKEMLFLESIEDKYSYLNIYRYETQQNQDIFKKIGDSLNIDNFGYVPATFIGDDYIVGFRDAQTTGQQIEKLIEKYYQQGDPDTVGKIISGEEIDPSPTPPVTEAKNKRQEILPDTVSIPILGNVDIKNLSLPALTFFLALADGFNPCAMWVLLFLISILLGMESRKRAYTLGFAFIFTSAVVYFLFLSAWLNLFLAIGVITWIRAAVGIFALGAGIYQIVDFCQNRDSGCVATGGEKRKKVFEKIKEVTKQQNIFIALIGIVVLAVAVNMVELVCSLGLPALYTQVLSLTPMSALKYYSYLAFYVLIFMIDDLFVFFIAMITLHQTAIQTKYARYSKLIGGIIILILGILLLFRPEALMFS